MTHKEVINQWIGSRYQEDPQYWYQCVSWVKKYCELLNIPLLWFSWSALNAWKSGSPFGTWWTKINNSLLSVPKAGDIAFFDATPTNPYGHVAIVDEKSNMTRINIIDQNGWTGRWDGLSDNAITLRQTWYGSTKWRGKCLGWYRYGKTHTPRWEEALIHTPPHLQEDPLLADSTNKINRLKNNEREPLDRKSVV